MNFDLSEEQQLLKDSVAGLIARHYDFEARARVVASATGWSRDLWRQFAEQGLTGLPFAEADGGFAGGAVETMLVAEAFGRALVVEPWLETVVLCGALLRHGAGAATRAALVPAIVDGSVTWSFAHEEAHSRWDTTRIATRATPVGGGWRLDGTKVLVAHGGSVDRLIVSARTGGEQGAATGLGLFAVDRAATGVTVTDHAVHDGRRAAGIRFDGVFVAAGDALGDPAGAGPVIDRAIDEAIAALCADAVGAMEAALDMTVDYLKTRRQFGVAIGGFQALQHRAADMYVALEQARSMTLVATRAVDEPEATARAAAISAAKVQVARSARFIAEQAIQLHGGIGMTMEYKVGHLAKRLVVFDKLHGDSAHHLARLAAGPGLFADA